MKFRDEEDRDHSADHQPGQAGEEDHPKRHQPLGCVAIYELRWCRRGASGFFNLWI